MTIETDSLSPFPGGGYIHADHPGWLFKARYFASGNFWNVTAERDDQHHADDIRLDHDAGAAAAIAATFGKLSARIG